MAISKNKVFIAGQKGFLGKALAARLTKQGYHLLPNRNKDLTILDEAIRETKNADIIINSAGIITSRVDQLKRPAKIFYVNDLIQLQLLEAAVQNKVKQFVTIASSAAYPQIAPSPLKEEWLTKGFHPDIEAGATYYALSKWFAIQAANAYAKEHDLATKIIILPNLYGPEDKFNHEIPPLIPNLIKKIVEVKKNNLKSFEAGSGPGNQIDLLYIDDAADLIMAVIRQNTTGSSTINGGYGRSVSIEKVCKLISQNLLFKGAISWADKKKTDPRFLSNKLSRKLYRWHPKVSIEEGIARTVQWYLKYGQKIKS